MSPFNPKQFQQAFFARLDQRFQLDVLFDYLPEIYFYAKDEHSRFVRVNTTLLRLYGLKSEADVIGKTDYDFHPHDLAERYIDEDRRVREGMRPIPNQVWLVPHAGVLKWYISSKTPLFGDGGKVIGIAGAMRDVEKAGSVLGPYHEMAAVVAHVTEHYHQRLDVAELASLTHLSVSQFDRKFKKLFQMTPQQYILRVRMNAAAQALTSTDDPISAIAQRCGFYDQSYFTRQFRRVMKATPRSYRRQYCAEQNGGDMGRPRRPRALRHSSVSG